MVAATCVHAHRFTTHATLNDNQHIIALDVRSLNDYGGKLGHIAGSSNIPIKQLNYQLGELDGDRHRPLTLVCHTDRRSAKAVDILHQARFSHVAVLQGDMEEWGPAGLPVQRL